MNLELSIADLFLLAWAISATVVASYCNQRCHKAMKGGLVLCMIIADVASGEATLSKDASGKITIKKAGMECVLKEVG